MSFLGAYTTQLALLKSNLTVTLYGSYEQVYSGSLERLERLKACLRLKGYTRSSRVADYPDRELREGESEEAYAAEKSIQSLEQSDVNILVVFCRAPEGSLGTELGWLANSDNLSGTIVLYEEACYQEFETLLRGIPQFKQIEWDKFENDDDLCVKATNKALNVVHSLQSAVRIVSERYFPPGTVSHGHYGVFPG